MGTLRTDHTESRSRLFAVRIAVFVVTAAVVAGLDLWTKARPHEVVLHHYSVAAPTKLAALGLCLFVFALYRTRTSALAAGLYFGALCGNGGELIAHGYATDWIVFDPRPFSDYALVTNIADICVAMGLLALMVEFSLTVRRRKREQTGPRSVRVLTLFAALCGLLAGVIAHDLSIGLIVAILIDMEVRVVVWVAHRQERQGRQPSAVR